MLENLNHYTGTEAYHRLTLLPLKCTDGVKYIAETAGAFWMIDAIASYQPKLKKQPFQHWTFKRVEKGGILACTNGNNKRELITQDFTYTDFPQDIDFYCVDGVLMLPSEY